MAGVYTTPGGPSAPSPIPSSPATPQLEPTVSLGLLHALDAGLAAQTTPAAAAEAETALSSLNAREAEVGNALVALVALARSDGDPAMEAVCTDLHDTIRKCATLSSSLHLSAAAAAEAGLSDIGRSLKTHLQVNMTSPVVPTSWEVLLIANRGACAQARKCLQSPTSLPDSLRVALPLHQVAFELSLPKPPVALAYCRGGYPGG